MCIFGKKPPESVYVAPDHMPSMTKREVLDKLEEDILIHEWWAAKVTEDPGYAASMGDYDWHMAWIEVYENCIHYIEAGGSE